MNLESGKWKLGIENEFNLTQASTGRVWIRRAKKTNPKPTTLTLHNPLQPPALSIYPNLPIRRRKMVSILVGWFFCVHPYVFLCSFTLYPLLCPYHKLLLQSHHVIVIITFPSHWTQPLPNPFILQTVFSMQ